MISKKDSLIAWLKQLDRILRGEATRPDDMAEHNIPISISGLALVILLLAMIHGACMGTFALFRVVDDPALHGVYHRAMQLIATTVKVPILFLLTLAITFPSLYVFNALVGSRLSFVALMKLLVAALAVNVTVLASLGPIVAFFSVSTTGYSFMVLLNVAVFAVAGVLGLYFLLQTLHRMSILPPLTTPTAGSPKPSQSAARTESANDEPAASDDNQTDSTADADTQDNAKAADGNESPTEDEPVDAQMVEQPGALDWLGGNVLGDHVRTVFYCWVVLFGLVGAQMGWVLRPFIGDPDKPFTWFRPRESNFFEAVWHSFLDLLM
jgi:hypothetical protein